MNQQQVNFEIETLLKASGVVDHEFRRVDDHRLPLKSEMKTRNRHHSSPADLRLSLLERARQLFTNVDKDVAVETLSDEEDLAVVDRVIRGDCINDLPTQYVAKGLYPHEFPVIGTCVDPSIAIGFRYRVRRLGSKTFYYGGQALTLMSIGKGYGKRLTFESFNVLENNNYFWSDSQPEGFAFSLVVAEAGQEFDVHTVKGCRKMGTAVFEEVDAAQTELTTKVLSDGTMIKKVKIVAQALFHYGADHHGLMSLHSEEALQISGIVTIQRAPRSRKAVVKNIQVDHPNLGLCNFFPMEE